MTNDEAKKEVEKVNLEYSNYEKKQYKEHISQFKYETFKDPALRRQFKYLTDIGISALNESDVVEVRNFLRDLWKIHNAVQCFKF